jgi:hypothetical protein
MFKPKKHDDRGFILPVDDDSLDDVYPSERPDPVGEAYKEIAYMVE